MRLALKNLALIFACPSLVLWHLVGALQCVPALSYAWGPSGANQGLFSSYLVVPLWSGLVGTLVLQETLVRPFAFCLPGHRTAFRSAVLLLGVVVAVVPALTVLARPGLSGTGLLAAFWSASCLALLVYLVVACIVLALQHTSAIVPLYMCILAPFIELEGLRVFTERLALFSPVANSFALGVGVLLSWRILGDRDLARRAHARGFLPLRSMFDRIETAQFAAAMEQAARRCDESRMARRVERRYLAGMRRRAAYSLRRYALGKRYELVRRALPKNPWSVAVVVAVGVPLLVLVGYLRPHSFPAASLANLAYLAPPLVLGTLFVPTRTTLLLPAGRRERFLGELSTSAFLAAFALAGSALVWLSYRGLGHVAPSITFRGETYTIAGADLWLLHVPLVVQGLLSTCLLVFGRLATLPQIGVVVAFLILIEKSPLSLSAAAPLGLVLWIGIPWGLYALVLHRICFRRDLVLA